MRPFSELTEQGRLRRLRKLAEATLPAYSLADAKLHFIQHAENTTYRVDTASTSPVETTIYTPNRYLLRIHGPHYHTRAEIESEQRWLHALRSDLGLAVPEPLQSAEGTFALVQDLTGDTQPRICTVMRWMEGRLAENATKAHHVEAVGRLMAQLHSHAAQWTAPADFTRRRWDWDSLVGGNMRGDLSAEALWELIPSDVRSDWLMIRNDFEQALQQLDESSANWGLIHADLHSGNVLFVGNEARAIDFDDCGWGYWIYDMAVVLMEWRATAQWEEMRDAFFAGYTSMRPIHDDMLQHLDTFIATRRLTVALWVYAMAVHDPSFQAYKPWILEKVAAMIEAIYIQH